MTIIISIIITITIIIIVIIIIIMSDGGDGVAANGRPEPPHRTAGLPGSPGISPACKAPEADKLAQQRAPPHAGLADLLSL